MQGTNSRTDGMSAYDVLRLDDAGTFWVEDYEADGNGPATWTVVDCRSARARDPCRSANAGS